MATISVGRDGEQYRIAISGTFAARDLKRLEHACRDALQQEYVPIELDVADVTTMDDAARTYLDGLQARGARVCGTPSTNV